MLLLHSRRFVRRSAIAALIIGFLILLGWIVISFGVIFTGTVYRCARVNSPACTREPLAGIEVYLLNNVDDRPSPSTVLQVTTSDAAGRFWFFGAPPGAVAVVRVGKYQPNTWLGSSDAQPYCAFTDGWTQPHEIEILSPEDYRTVIGDFGGLYLSLKTCPQTLR